MATYWNQSKRSRSSVEPRSRVTSENVRHTELLFGMSELEVPEASRADRGSNPLGA
jgi:hypothetical protein